MNECRCCRHLFFSQRDRQEDILGHLQALWNGAKGLEEEYGNSTRHKQYPPD